MRLLAAVPAVDTSGDRLRLTVEATDHAAVASVPVTVEVGGRPCRVVLEVLAASHRVRIEGPDGIVATETVACGSEGAVLGDHHRWGEGDARFELTAEVARPGLDDLRRLATRLAETFDHHPAGVLVAFPGDDAAVTAVEATATGWRTWHLYPDPTDPHVVTTTTTVIWAPA